MQHKWLARAWRWRKPLLTVIILSAVGWRLGPDLRNPELWRHSLHFGWLVASGVLYILGLGCAAALWYRLLRGFNQHPSPIVAMRAYSLGLLGKYVPGKAWALWLRAGLVRGPRTSLGVALATALYEVLATMASGVLLSAILFTTLFREPHGGERWNLLAYLFDKQPSPDAVPDFRGLVVLSVALLGVLGVPLVPSVFNGLMRRFISLRSVVKRDSRPSAGLPQFRLRFLGEGFVIAAGCWLLWGLSLWAVLRAIEGTAQIWTWELWLRYTAIVALAYVAGFVIVIVPSGLGIREFLLVLLLVPELAVQLGTDTSSIRAIVILAVLVLRVIWTMAELAVAVMVFWLPGPTPAAMRVELARQGERA